MVSERVGGVREREIRGEGFQLVGDARADADMDVDVDVGARVAEVVGFVVVVQADNR